ncbi:histidine kinase [filamentous cyanobacterium CCP5]|nr:histidine kinase [filamentous cyanobacterium CCP5]
MAYSATKTLFSLTTAIDHRPLTVEADMPVRAVIDTMAEAQKSCVLSGLELSLNTVLKTQARGSSIWVVENDRLLGQFTQADALGLVAANQAGKQAIATVMTAPVAQLTLAADSPCGLDEIMTALESLRQHRARQLPVLDGQAHLVGIINPEGIRSALQLDQLLKASTLADIMRSPVLTAVATSSILQLAQLMAEHRQDCVVLTDPDHSLVGLMTDADIVQLHRLGLDLDQIPAGSVMQMPLLQLAPDRSALEGYWIMQQHQTQRFVVVDSTGTLLGLVTPTTFLYTLQMDQMQQVTADLQQSIAEFTSLRASGQGGSTTDEQRLGPVESSRLLSTMALHIRESLDAKIILQTAVDEVRKFLDCDRVLVYQFNPDLSGTVVVESLADGWRPALNSTVKDTCFGQNYAQAYKHGRHQVVDDIYTAGLSQCHIDILVLFDVRASLVVPILQGNHLWGLLCAYHCAGPRHWPDFEVDLLTQLATHMAIAIQQSELYGQLQNELRERQQIEAELKTSLREKETLLKEIHHRVKNNLQIISSVLRLQTDYIHDNQVLSLFQDSQNRIRSMALIHEKLYKSRDLTQISMDEYIQDLATSLLTSHQNAANDIDLNVHAGEVWLNIDSAIPCGLIINELVSNALKHAFPEAKAGPHRIEITMAVEANHSFTLSVLDNGIGFPSELDFQNTESLGLELVCVFTEQLGGTIELNSDDGTRFVVTFPESPDDARRGI